MTSRHGPCRHLPLDPLGHELELVLDVLLEIAVGRAARHRPDRAHAAIGFVGAALVEEGLARRLLGAGEQRADHHRRGAGGERLGDVAAGPEAAVGDHRRAGRRRRLGGVHDRGQLRHADAGDDAGGADRARADADLHRVRAGADQRLGRLGGGDVAGDDLDRVGGLADPLDRGGDLAVVAVGGVDDDQVAFGVDQRLRCARSPCRRPWSRRRRAAARSRPWSRRDRRPPSRCP